MLDPLSLIFWLAAGLLLWSQVGYPLLLTLLQLVLRRDGPQQPVRGTANLPFVSIVVAAYREAGVIAKRVENLKSLDWPADRMELIVACDGSDDGTQAAARAAGAKTPRRASQLQAARS